MNGQFFICDIKKNVHSYSSSKLSIDVTVHPTGAGDEPGDGASSSETYNILDSISVGQAVEIPKLTY